jgi:molybdopterin synthase catalytic subunit
MGSGTALLRAGRRGPPRNKDRMIDITTEPIDTEKLLGQMSSPQAGAVVLFLGTTREFTAGRQTASLDYECYPEMARDQLTRLESEARRRWPLVDCAIVHRVGHLELGEASVVIAVSTRHRQAAFEAGQWLIDTLKQVVPIWKKENWADGQSQWMHPGMDVPRVAAEPADGQRDITGSRR